MDFSMKNILVLCTGNSCRSQMAHGYLEYFTDSDKVKVYSAGVETHGVNLKAIAIMQEEGIDISHYTSNNIDEYFDIPFEIGRASSPTSMYSMAKPILFSFA